MKRPKVLLIGPKPASLKNVGGASSLFKILVDELQKIERIETAVIYYKSGRDTIVIKTVRLITLLIKMINKIYNSDIVSLHCSRGLPYLAIPTWVLCKIFRKKLILRQFGSPDYKDSNFLIRLLLFWLKNRCDLVLLETKFQIENNNIWDNNRIRWFPNHRQSYTRTKPISKRCQRFVYIGYIHPCKGIYEISNAASMIRLNYPISFFGPLDKKINVKELFAHKNLIYKGIIKPEEVMTVLEQYDALLVPSYWPKEGHPGIILEAYQVGIPVITTNWRAITEIADESCAIIVPPKDVFALKNAMRTLLESPELYNLLCIGARKKASEFSASFWANKFADYCIESLGNIKINAKHGYKL